MTSVVPVIQEAASLARKTAPAAMSDGSPSRRNGRRE
jgi:hypothetical protein